MRDLALARLTGGPAPLPAPVDRPARSRWCGAAKADGPAGHGRGHAPPLHAHRRARAPATTRCSRSTRRCAPTPTSPRCRPGLADGTIDAIATDHAPHAPEAKEQPFDQAPPGMLGLETALALALTELDLPVARGARPAVVAAGGRIAGLADAHGGPIAEGRPANLCVIDPTATWTVEPGAWRQPQPQHPLRRPRRSPGRVRHTVLRGRARRRRRRGAAMSGHAQPHEPGPGRACGRPAGAGRRHDVRGRGHRRRRRPAASPPARSCSTPS